MIGLVGSVFTNGLGDQGRVIPKGPRSSYTKTQKMVLDASLLNTQHCKVQIKGKLSKPGKVVVHSHTPRYLLKRVPLGCPRVCVCVGVVSDFTYSYFFSVSMCECVSRDFVCVVLWFEIY